ncbi:MAG TPA: response regulator [Nannocystis exedens]|nr:response regulator [Nannocystis exedens]
MATDLRRLCASMHSRRWLDRSIFLQTSSLLRRPFDGLDVAVLTGRREDLTSRQQPPSHCRIASVYSRARGLRIEDHYEAATRPQECPQGALRKSAHAPYPNRRGLGDPVEGTYILIVEDDPGVAALTQELLEREHYRVNVEPSGARAAERILAEQPHLVLLDVMLPGEDGFAICRRVRPAYSGPILMFTARDEEIDEIVGLEMGADDYLPKTASPRIMLARVRALLRRHAPDSAGQEGSLDRRSVGPMVIDRRVRRVTIGHSSLELTTAEFDLLWLLARRPGEVAHREKLYSDLRGIEYNGQDRSIDVLVSRVRRKLLGSSLRITAVRSVGYLLAHELD